MSPRHTAQETLRRRLHEAFDQWTNTRGNGRPDAPSDPERAFARQRLRQHLMGAFFDALSRDDLAAHCHPVDLVRVTAEVLVAAATGAHFGRPEVRMIVEAAFDDWETE